MVVVATTVADRLKAADALSDLDPLHDADLFELLEDSIDARSRYTPAALSEGVFDLKRRQRAPLAAKQLQELSSCAAAPVAGVRELVERAIGPPLLIGWLLHALIVRRSPMKFWWRSLRRRVRVVGAIGVVPGW